jgi:hypothetical protein
MFNAGNGRSSADDEFEKQTDQFAAELEDRLKNRSLSERRQLMDQLLAVVGNDDNTSSFAAGTYAQNSSGQPAQALGSGSSGSGTVPADLQQALQVIGSDSRVTHGMMNAVGRILSDPTDAGHIRVEPDGTPTELKNTKTERDDAKTELKNERDENHSGSLAEQLKAEKAKAKPAPAAGTVAKADVKPLVDELETLANGLHGPMGVKVSG